MVIEDLAISQLRPYPRNARTHSKKQIRQIAKSIERFGFNNPVLVNDQNQIIAGHGRVEAAKMLGIARVPVVRLSHLSEADVKAYVLADNQLATKAGWDREILATEFQALIDLNYDVELTGFEVPEIALVVEGSQSNDRPAGPEETIPPYPDGAPVSRPGDVWVLGPHRLVCGDPHDQAAYDAVLEGQRARFVFADPLSIVGVERHIQNQKSRTMCGERTETKLTECLEAIFHRLADNTAAGSLHMICMDWQHQFEVLTAGRKVYSGLADLCVWTNSKGSLHSLYRSQHELVFVWRSGAVGEPKVAEPSIAEPDQHRGGRTNVWTHPAVTRRVAPRKQLLQSAIKPVALVADAIEDCSRCGDLVLDPCCGNATVLMAAERTGRSARGIEMDPGYVDVAVQRWQNRVGKSAILASSGETFDQVRARQVVSTAAA